MVDFLNKLELSDKNHTNGNVIDENYKGKLLFNMKNFVPFYIDRQSMCFLSAIFLKDKINGVRVPQFQLDYICGTTHPSHKHLVKLCCEVHYIW